VCCVADGGASGAGTEEGTSFRDTSRVAISLPDHPLRMCDVMNRNGQRVYCPLLAAADFSQQRVKREWFGDQGICSYHRIMQARRGQRSLTTRMNEEDGRRGGRLGLWRRSTGLWTPVSSQYQGS